ncbi:MAG: manganese efflux pump [Lachnospiraceae bacterium]|nr:manganese efflux pump [Lachnospiraceae bacterium]
MKTFGIVLLMGLGLTAYFYGISVCKGAQLMRVEKKQAILSLLFAIAWFVITLSAGYGLAALLLHMDITDRTYPINSILCVLVFALIAIRMFFAAIRQTPVKEERLDEAFVKEAVRFCLSVGISVFLAGFALGLLEISYTLLLCCVALLPILGILAGLRVGYFYGYWQRVWAYVVGGLLMLAGNISLICGLF